jgi:hypothetical protein
MGKLQAELDELERTDPKVRAAREKYDKAVAKILSQPLPERKG